MNPIQSVTFKQVITPAAIVDNASFTTTEIDTLGWDYATFVFSLGATDVAMSALKVQHSTQTGTGFADITGATFDGGINLDGNAATLPSATDDGKVYVLHIDLRSKNRFLDLVATIGDGSTGGYASCLCILSQAEQLPSTVAGIATGNVVIVN